MGVAAPHRLRHLVPGRVVDVVVPDLGDRRGVAMAHAGRADDPDLAGSSRSRSAAISRCAPIISQVRLSQTRMVERRRRRLAFLDRIEVGVEGRDLVNLGLGQAHLVGERGQMRGREMAVAVLDQVQVLDQQIAPARPVAEQRLHLLERLVVDLPPLGMPAAPPFARARMALPARLACGFDHLATRSLSLGFPARRGYPGPVSLAPACNNRARCLVRQTRARPTLACHAQRTGADPGHARRRATQRSSIRARGLLDCFATLAMTDGAAAAAIVEGGGDGGASAKKSGGCKDQAMSSYRSRQVGFAASISTSLLRRDPALICFSRAIAANTSVWASYQTSNLQP